MFISKKTNAMITTLLIVLTSSAIAFDGTYTPISIENISRYSEDRISYQHIQKSLSDRLDDSFSALLIVKDRNVYHIQDGFDNPQTVASRRVQLEMETQLIPNLWENKINNQPDFVRITDRKVEVVRNTNEEYVSKNFGSFFINVRNAFINKHVEVFKQLMINRKESGLIVQRTRIPVTAFFTAQPAPAKYKLTVRGKTNDEAVYFAEDADGDGITETFTVNNMDGFHWGHRSGPNIIMIYNNQEADIKNMIGQLCNWAYYGTAEEEKMIIKKLPKDSDIIKQFNLQPVQNQAPSN